MKNRSKPACAALVLITFLFITCCKDRSATPKPDDPRFHPTRLIREIYWKTYNHRAAISYRTDSLIGHIRYTDPRGQTDLATYEYKDNTLISINLTSSLSKKTYEYDSKNRLTTIWQVKKNAGPLENAQKLTFFYDGDGKVQKLERYQITPAGIRLSVVHDYEYDNMGELIRVRTHQADGYKTVTNIEGFSSKFDYDPWLFAEEFGSPDYAIYNFPVLSAMKGRLPLQMTYHVPANDGTFKSVRLTSQQFEVEDQKIKNLKVETHFPGVPEADNYAEISFKY